MTDQIDFEHFLISLFLLKSSWILLNLLGSSWIFLNHCTFSWNLYKVIESYCQIKLIEKFNEVFLDMSGWGWFRMNTAAITSLLFSTLTSFSLVYCLLLIKTLSSCICNPFSFLVLDWKVIYCKMFWWILSDHNCSHNCKTFNIGKFLIFQTCIIPVCNFCSLKFVANS